MLSGYKEKIYENITTVHMSGIANKILQFMGKIRNESDISQARRWVMELLQNAGDLATNGPVRVRITITDRKLSFEHTGNVFRVKDIMSIIHQVSSKNPGEGIGQFGTGFMSTYQLSEIIELDSFLHEDGMPYKKFHVTLNRTGQTKEEILQAIDNNIAEINNVDDMEEEKNFELHGFNTKFTYNLNNNYSKNIARVGMDDLAENILYILTFSEKIDSVELVYDLPDKKEKIEYRKGNKKALIGGLWNQSVFEGTIEHRIILMEQEVMEKTLTIAAEYKENGFQKISQKTPKLFIDFPLIGGQEFPFPIVLNHSGLKPNEPRSGISLIDNLNSQDSKINCKIIDAGVILYGRYLHQLTIQEYKGIENIISVPALKPNKEWSEFWVNRNLYDALYNLVSKEKFMPYEDGRISLSDTSLKLIKADDTQKRENIRNVMKYMKNIIIPFSEIDWFSAFEGYDIPKDKYLKLDEILENAGKYLREELDEEKISVTEWCVKLYETSMKDAYVATGIVAGIYAIFLSQSKEDFDNRRLYRINELYLDCDIPEILKDVSEALDELGTSDLEQPLEIRKMLFNKGYQMIQDERMTKYEIGGLINYIIRRSNRNYKVKCYNLFHVKYTDAWEKAWKLMISCGPDEEMYLLVKTYFNDDMFERNVLNDARFTQELWIVTYKSILSAICDSINKYARLEDVLSYLKLEVEEGIKWLNWLYSKVARYNLINYNHVILIPNQNGNMSNSNYLYLDEVQDDLKEIIEAFGDMDMDCRLKEKLVDKRINLDSWKMISKKDAEIALQINSVIQKLLCQSSLSEASIIHQEACTRLLAWIGEHTNLAEKYFPAFCKEEDQMKLLTPNVAVKMSNKAKMLDKLLNETGFESEDNMNMIIDIIKKGKKYDSNNLILGEDESLKYDSITGVLYSESDFDVEGSSLEDILRKIGNAGEKYALEYLKEQLIKQGYSIIDDKSNKIKLQGENDIAEIFYPDVDNYHQPGWDICITYGENAEKKDYYEVKTHTYTSKLRNILHISNEQMIKAIEAGEHYSILKIDYNLTEEKVVNCVQYHNPLLQLSKRKLVNNEKGYYWKVN